MSSGSWAAGFESWFRAQLAVLGYPVKYYEAVAGGGLRPVDRVPIDVMHQLSLEWCRYVLSQEVK